MIINCIIVDDETKARNNLRQLLHEYCPSIKILDEASSATGALKLINQHQIDLLFLDIEMGTESGFDLLRSLNGNQNFEIIFVTAFDKYGIQAVKSCAIDYLLKPINILELTSAVEKAIRQIAPKKENIRLKELIANIDRAEDEQRIAIPLTDKIEFVAVANIIRLEAEGNYTHIYLTGGKKYLVCKTLKEYHELLENHNFLRTHQSHLINYKKISAYVKKDGGYLSMEDNSQIPISRQKKEEILAKILK
ncbi:LytR/AlgR family response regulator transcription factor [Pedobacter metabolipauper]|uniref:LytTR family two component transcriptional regulator n=1 Tax=Pedobacter metabolipauper TaxID=425513 RepID=A0A4R6STY1_9SPHI|nr:LytTR family DNA-binding domain-containing protein [Pedobacter metabolipauper]TDQ08393.1 LytTR family two component transcriptional regulator [Pedobacter metabolipauper]